MFIEGLHHSDEQFGHDAMEISKSFLAIMKFYQNKRPSPEMLGGLDMGALPEGIRAQAGTITTHVIYAAAAFSLAVLIKELQPRERRRLREYLVSKFDEVLAEHGA